MNFPLYIQGKEKTISVIKEIKKDNITEEEKKELINGKGYLDEDGFIWIYNEEGKPKDANKYPYFWLDENKDIQFSNPTEETMVEFNKEKLVDLSIPVIVNKTKENEELYNEKAINDMNSAAAIFVPIIHETDDFLKKIVKRAIIEKHIDISRLKYKMDEKYILPNMKAALQNNTKMSVVYFITWMELLGLDFSLAVEDNGTDPQDVLKEPLVYLSRKDDVLRNSEI